VATEIIMLKMLGANLLNLVN